MEAGPGMVYPAQCLDGETWAALGGAGQLTSWVQHNLPLLSRPPPDPLLRHPGAAVRCLTGAVVWSPAFPASPALASAFKLGIIHTVAPYSAHPCCPALLTSCYGAALAEAAGRAGPGGARLATALLGTGVKQVAAEESGRALCRALQEAGQPGVTVELVLRPNPDMGSELKLLEQVFSEEQLVPGHP